MGTPKPPERGPRERSDQRGRLRNRRDLEEATALGLAIKVERTARGMDRKVLAELAGISYPYLSEIENGAKRPSSDAVELIADALGLSPSQLWLSAERLGESRRSSSPDRAMSRLDDAIAYDSMTSPAFSVARSMRGSDDERERLLERIRLMVGALDVDDLVRVSDLIDRMRR
jgi:transcriptional regulator with XRE-family HTH domain